MLDIYFPHSSDNRVINGSNNCNSSNSTTKQAWTFAEYNKYKRNKISALVLVKG